MKKQKNIWGIDKPFEDISKQSWADFDNDFFPNWLDCKPKNPKRKGVYLFVKEGPLTKWMEAGHYPTYEKAIEFYNKYYKGGKTKFKILFDKQVAELKAKQERLQRQKEEIKRKAKKYISEKGANLKENIKTGVAKAKEGLEKASEQDVIDRRQQAYQEGYAYQMGREKAEREMAGQTIKPVKKKMFDIWTGQWIEV